MDERKITHEDLLALSYDIFGPPDNSPPPPRKDYELYMRSQEWKFKRMQALERDGNKCRLCNGMDCLQVHHRTYQRFGDEMVEDLTTLCSPCHEQFHEVRRVL